MFEQRKTPVGLEGVVEGHFRLRISMESLSFLLISGVRIGLLQS
jgi:hypothetical protein